MRLIKKITPVLLLLCTAFPVFADFASEDTSQNTADLVKYLKYLGGYLGYDVTVDPTTVAPVNATLLNYNAAEFAQRYLVYTFLSAIPVVAINESLSQFIPGNDAINSTANAVYKNPPYNSGRGPVTANPLVDQQTYQNDPVSQSLLDVLATPDISNCFAYGGAVSNPEKCPYLYQYKVLENVVGKFPNPDEPNKTYFSYDYNAPLLSQLNVDSLLGPLVYETTNQRGQQGPQGAGSNDSGLVGKSQAENAANFVRYASSIIVPLTLPDMTQYRDAYFAANTKISQTTSKDEIEKILTARHSLDTYFAGLRVYAAQVSVGLSNLYYSLAQRMPLQTSTEAGSTPTSQALTEFNMATWRILPSKSSSGATTNWIEQINNGSSASVQKEMAILLAEINYQLYLSRQQQERLLMTNTILLIQNAKNSQPSPNITTNVGEPNPETAPN